MKARQWVYLPEDWRVEHNDLVFTYHGVSLELEMANKECLRLQQENALLRESLGIKP